MKALSTRLHKHLFLVPGSLLLCLLLLVLSACSTGGSGTTGGSATPTPHSNTPTPTMSATAAPNSTPSSASTPGSDVLTPPSGVQLGVQPCPGAVKNPSYWGSIIHSTGSDHVESVSCANLVGTSTLQALVTVRSEGTGQFLNVYVYNNITSASPAPIFQLQHLERADAKISGYNTILTGETDETSSVNKGAQGDAALKQDLYREFKWSGSANAFVPASFPGLFPDLTRFQAEADQAQVDSGQDAWKLNALITAQTMAATLLKWHSNAPATLINGGGVNDIKAVVMVQNPAPGGSTIKVTMYRLESKTTNGIWEVTKVETGGAAITTLDDQSSITSPTTIQGMGNAVAGKIGTIVILDHTYTNIGQADASGATGNGNIAFTTTVPYVSTATSGTISKSPTEEGIVALYTYSPSDGSIATVVMVKVLLYA